MNRTIQQPLLLAALLLAGAQAPLQAAPDTSFTTRPSGQPVRRTQPVWWFGGAVAGNLNFYGGTTQQLNDGFMTPAPFHKGFGAGLYLAPLVEYRPGKVWGGILQVGYDDRRADFFDVTCPCGETATLSAKPSYISIEPSLRIAPFAGDFYLFLGPRVGFRWSAFGEDKTFVYTQDGANASTTKAEFDNTRTPVYSGQLGMGYDIKLAPSNARTQVHLAPFASFQPYFGQDPRTVENWAVSTLRIGAALKFGRGKIIPNADVDVRFSVRAPKTLAARRRVRETFPLRNYVFFDGSSTEIPARYVVLNKKEAAAFKEEDLQQVEPKSMKGRSDRQMAVYHNLLNTLGDRMRRSPGTTITLSGASEQGPEHGKARAEAVKTYLVEVYAIDGARIRTEGRDKPRIPSEPVGATRELDLLREGDRRVDIISDSPEMLVQVGGGPHTLLKPVQIVAIVPAPVDSVIFNNVGARAALTSWSLELTDDEGKVTRHGPYTRDREAIPGNTILGERPRGHYKVVMLGETKKGGWERQEAEMDLSRSGSGIREAVRFSILFDFGQPVTVASYSKFLTEMVVPYIPDGSVVIIRGHSDIVGPDDYNENLSRERAEGTQSVLQRALAAEDKNGVTFDTQWFGENLEQAPFDNALPEERFYNRTVIIDILPN
jgi:outer membrane protein OmpA-like peptidoglycan-associated protein